MVFKCQEDSFLREYTSTVKSCKKAEYTTLINGKKTKLQGFDVILENTILFPEGGGQPCDFGWMGDKQVLRVTRNGGDALHFLTEELVEGSEIHQKVDWPRRFDHMQQHSGQHLLSAILERDHNVVTTSWWLGEEESYVELDCKTLDLNIINKVEETCNNLIRDAIPVSIIVCDRDNPCLDAAHTRGLPDDVSGPVRIISIDGVDKNLCCGTHVTNLSQLQVIKLIKSESGKKDKINLHFLVGSRVVSSLQTSIQREQGLTTLLKNEPGKHIELVDKLQKALKIANKTLKNALTDLAALETDNIKVQDPLPSFVCLHRKDGDSDYMRQICRGLEGLKIFIFLTIGDGKQGGSMLMEGDEKHIQKLAPEICKILDGKGAGKGNKYQAKVNNLTDISKCHEIVKAHFQSLNEI